MNKQSTIIKQKKMVSNKDIKRLIIERLKRISPSTMISVGLEGDFSPSELIELVKKENSVGNSFAEMQMEWLRSFQEEAEDK